MGIRSGLGSGASLTSDNALALLLFPGWASVYVSLL